MSHDALKSDDIVRLMNLTCAISTDLQCDASKAVDFIELAVSRSAVAPARPRSAAEFVHDTLRLRSRRNAAFGADLFRDPAWDMLLQLYAAGEDGLPMSVSGLCYGSGVPPTTALRHLDRLDALGLVARETDLDDHRRMIVRLEPAARERLGDLIAQMRGCT